MQMAPRLLLSNWKHARQFFSAIRQWPRQAARAHAHGHTHLLDILMSFERGNCPGRRLNMEVLQLLCVWLQAKIWLAETNKPRLINARFYYVTSARESVRSHVSVGGAFESRLESFRSARVHAVIPAARRHARVFWEAP